MRACALGMQGAGACLSKQPLELLRVFLMLLTEFSGRFWRNQSSMAHLTLSKLAVTEIPAPFWLLVAGQSCHKLRARCACGYVHHCVHVCMCAVSLHAH